VRLEHDDSKNTTATDFVLFGDDQGYVTLMSVDARDLTERTAGAEGKSGAGQDRRNVYVEPKNLVS